MKIVSILGLIVLLFSGFYTADAQQDTLRLKQEYRTKSLPFGFTCDVPADMPIVGLALSGGGARGISQVGVIKALEEEGIKFDLLVGTSIGSIIGGLYSAGFTTAYLDSISSAADWDELLTIDTKENRNELFIDQKITEDRAVFSLRLKGFEPVLPTSINDGQKLLNFLNLLTLQAPLQVKNNFDELELKFRAVCTDLERGVPYVLRSGSLSRAMRASSSVSFFLSPVKIDSLILVDGGLVANTPAEITKNEGADFVIAVNTTSPLNSKEELGLPWIYADQVVSIPMKLVNKQQLSFADALIEPELKGFTAADFSDIRGLIDEGYRSAKLKTLEIKKQIDTLYFAKLKKDEFYIHSVMPVHDTVPGSMFINRYAEMDSVSSAQILFDSYLIKRSEEFRTLEAIIVHTEEGTKISFSGEKYPIVRKVRCQGITLLDSARISEITAGIEGKRLFCPRAVRVIKELLIEYNNKGYSLAELKKKHFDEETGELTLTFNEGIISELRIVGNEKTNEANITRELAIKNGDIFQNEMIQNGLMNLRGTGLFNAVDITVEKYGDENIIILRVEEKISGVLRLGFRVTNENTPRVSIDIRDENILGTATELGGLFFLSPRHNRVAFEHKANRIFNTYITYNINAFYEIRDRYYYVDEPNTSERSFSRKREGSYRERIYGLALSVGTQTGRFGNLILQARYEVNKLRNLELTPIGEYDINLFTLRWSSVLDTRDRYPFSREGFYFSGYYETAQEIFNGELGYSKLYGDYRGFFSINDRHTFQTRITVGIADKTLPLTKQFALGGQHSFFGMRENEFRGRQVFRASLEYRFLLPFTLFFDTYFKFRYDIGSMWTETEQIRIKDLRHGIGASLSFDTPLGPADFALGRSFLFSRDLPDNPIKVGPLYFYFSIGYKYQW